MHSGKHVGTAGEIDDKDSGNKVLDSHPKCCRLCKVWNARNLGKLYDLFLRLTVRPNARRTSSPVTPDLFEESKASACC